MEPGLDRDAGPVARPREYRVPGFRRAGAGPVGLGEDRVRAADPGEIGEAFVAEQLEERPVGEERLVVAIDQDADRELVEEARFRFTGFSRRFARRRRCLARGAYRLVGHAHAERFGDAAKGILLAAGQPLQREDADRRTRQANDIGRARGEADNPCCAPRLRVGSARGLDGRGLRPVLDDRRRRGLNDLIGGRRRLRCRFAGLRRRSRRRKRTTVVEPDHAEAAIAGKRLVRPECRQGGEIDRNALPDVVAPPIDGHVPPAPQARQSFGDPILGVGGERDGGLAPGLSDDRGICLAHRLSELGRNESEACTGVRLPEEALGSERFGRHLGSRGRRGLGGDRDRFRRGLMPFARRRDSRIRGIDPLLLRPDNEQEETPALRLDPRDAGRPAATLHDDRALDDRVLVLFREADHGVDRGGCRRECGKAPRGAQHLAGIVEHSDQPVLAGDRVGEPFRPRRDQFAADSARPDHQHGGPAAAEIETPAGGRQRHLAHAEAEAEDFEAGVVGGKPLCQARYLFGERASRREAARQDGAHAPLPEEFHAGGVGEKKAAAVAPEHHGRTRIKQDFGDARQGG